MLIASFLPPYLCVVLNYSLKNIFNYGTRLQVGSAPVGTGSQRFQEVVLCGIYKLVAARSTVSSADVKAVLDNLNYILDLELQDGRIVQLGEFGNFRITVGSEGVEDKKKFSASMIRAPKIVFTPGFDLRETKKTMGYSLITPEVEKTENPGVGNGRAALCSRSYPDLFRFLGGSDRGNT